MGSQDELKVGIVEPVFLTLTKGESKNLHAELTYTSDITAPVKKQQVVGQVLYKIDDKVVKQVDLVALEAVDEGSLFKRVVDWFKRWLSNLF